MKKILVANRGEIALRILRSVKEMGLKTVAVFSDPDRSLPFVKYADEAFPLNGVESSITYLNIDKIIKACKELNVDAVHPGYGFLSENAEFAERLEKEGITLIGPTPESIRVMGSKLEAKKAVSKFDIPLVPGSEGALKNKEEALKVANEIGYPIMLKASGGGGGKGMRIVRSDKELEEIYESTVREALKSFNDGSVFIEKFIENPKHIEFQILADSKGNVVHLFERDCSIQRRHQKVVEEAPSVYLNEALRKEMGDCAIKVAKSCNYIGAGTVEFIMDEKKNFYFLEMNTRLQVEHPVTEMITGVDLVKEQVSIAKGESLSFKQEDLKINGHSIEIRVYAEDSYNNFLPDSGVIKNYKIPSGPGIRLDDGYEEGSEVSIHYDPMISKLITHGANRSEAIIKMIRAIEDYRIVGVETTLPFCDFVMKNDYFVTGDFDTNFVSRYYKGSFTEREDLIEEEVAAIMAAFFVKGSSKNVTSEKREGQVSLWKQNRT